MNSLGVVAKIAENASALGLFEGSIIAIEYNTTANMFKIKPK